MSHARYPYSKSFRLRFRWQFQQIARHHKRCVGRWIIVDFRKTHYPLSRLGITVSRHYGIAVLRNRFKRIVREAFRLCRSELPAGLDLNIKPRSAAIQATPADIIAELKSLCCQ